ncbi:hypothetical protein FRC10_004829 [Ceratobasidium sp. 414]|nr:hypothetical protein FRC10_004829 [Ceratobasidium sp. 414]
MTSPGSKRSHGHSAAPDPAEKPHTTRQNKQGKDILVFCDGTGKDGDHADQLAGGTDLTPSGYATKSDGRPRMPFYVRGVGAGSARNPVNLLARVFGATIGQIYRIGLGVRERDELLERWRKHEKPVAWDPPDSRNAGKDIRIKLPPNVEHALHAMAFHENRRLFRATLFKSNGRTRLREIWFPGAHADVGGGGNAVSGLPNISLLWVIGEMAEYLKIPNDKLDYPDLGTLTPTDAYHDSSPCRRLLDKCETRLESKLLKPNSFVHETVAYLRNALPSSLDPRPKQTSHILSLQDLGAIQWDIKAYLFEAVRVDDAKDDSEFYFKLCGSFTSPVKRGSALFEAARGQSAESASI